MFYIEIKFSSAVGWLGSVSNAFSSYLRHCIIASAQVALESLNKGSYSPDLNCMKVNSNEDTQNQSEVQIESEQGNGFPLEKKHLGGE